MKCSHCKVKIGAEFSFALKQNQCPACGKQIMEASKLASYINLQELLKDNFPNIDADKVANLIVANFELKQQFKESKVVSENNKEEIVVEEEEVEEQQPQSDPDKEFDEAYKAKQIEEAKRAKRDAIYADALRKSYGMGSLDDDEPDPLFGEAITGEEDPIRLAQEMKREQEMERRRKALSSGAGAFRRTE